MSYKCQVCGQVTATNLGMRRHVVSSRFYFEEHWKWLKAHGLKPTRKIAAGKYQALMELIEKECKIDD